MTSSQLGEALRQRRTPSSRETDNALYKRRYVEIFQSPEKSLAMLCSDFSAALASEIEEVQTYHSHFKAALRRAFAQILRRSMESTQPVVMFHEAVPGYTLMLFKKGEPRPVSPDHQAHLDALAQAETFVSAAEAEDENEPPSIQWQAVSTVIGCYFERTGNRVLAIEAEDALLTFFPVSDMKRNLREMGYVGFKDD